MNTRISKAVNVYNMYISMWPSKKKDAIDAALIYLPKKADVDKFNKQITHG